MGEKGGFFNRCRLGTHGYRSSASDMMARECRHCACTFRSLSVGTSSCRNAAMRAWRSAQRVRRAVVVVGSSSGPLLLLLLLLVGGGCGGGGG